MTVVSLHGRTPRPWFIIAVLCWGIAMLCACSARAASIVEIGSGAGSSLSGLGSFTGSISYSAENAFSSTGTLIVSLTNTSDVGNGGFITGLLFNIGGNDSGASASLESATHQFATCAGNGLNGAPFGSFDGGAAIGGNFLGGGNPNPGIAVGQTGIFTFTIQAFDAGMLTAMDFLHGGAFDFNFLVRFRGFEDGGSDKVGAIIVPAPPGFAMAFVGWLGIAGGVLIRHRIVARRSRPDGTSSRG